MPWQSGQVCVQWSGTTSRNGSRSARSCSKNLSVDRRGSVTCWTVTGGHAAATGNTGRPWKLRKHYVEHGLLAVWRSCYLVTVSALELVPKLKRWRSSVTDLAEYFRALMQIWNSCNDFPRNVDLFLHISRSVLLNLWRKYMDTFAFLQPTNRDKEIMTQTVCLRYGTQHHSNLHQQDWWQKNYLNSKN
jgi:hypothetical protein